MCFVITGPFHVNAEDGAMGTIISMHRSIHAAERSLAHYNRQHRAECTCGGGRIASGKALYGKLYPR